MYRFVWSAEPMGTALALAWYGNDEVFVENTPLHVDMDGAD
jgi:hypothetical protein